MAPKWSRALAVAFVVAVGACGPGTRSLEEMSSEATLRERFVGGMLGRLERARVAGRDAPVTVCVERSEAMASPEAFRLEVQLAYAGWLGAAGTYGPRAWRRLRFPLAEDCEVGRNRHAAFIAVYDPERHRSTRVDVEGLRPPVLEIERHDAETRFRIAGGTDMGVGGTSPIRTTRRGDPAMVVRIRFRRASPLYLNPHYRWRTVGEVLRHDATLKADPRDRLLRRYRRLLQEPRSRTLRRLAAFTRRLARHEVRLSSEQALRRLVARRELEEAERRRVEVEPDASLLAILYHEVGHQIGFRHTADRGSVMFPASDERLALSARDRRFVRGVARNLRAYFEDHYEP